jgi:hypothetical protein
MKATSLAREVPQATSLVCDATCCTYAFHIWTCQPIHAQLFTTITTTPHIDMRYVRQTHSFAALHNDNNPDPSGEGFAFNNFFYMCSRTKIGHDDRLANSRLRTRSLEYRRGRWNTNLITFTGLRLPVTVLP